MLNPTYFHIYDPDLSLHFGSLSFNFNFILDTCCPFKSVYIRTDSFSSPKLKQLIRLKEWVYKCGDKAHMMSLSVWIIKETNYFNKKYVDSLTGNPNYWDVWMVKK